VTTIAHTWTGHDHDRPETHVGTYSRGVDPSHAGLQQFAVVPGGRLGEELADLLFIDAGIPQRSTYATKNGRMRCRPFQSTGR
jgi:hypothetical protein